MCRSLSGLVYIMKEIILNIAFKGVITEQSADIYFEKKYI